MPRTLHLTNGSSLIPLIRGAGLSGQIVPWDDVLHEGPVPDGLNAAALRERRAEFLASCGWGGAAAIGRDLATRDQALDAALGSGHSLNAARERVDEIVLWFEHDLYDQLQWLQILDRIPLDAEPRLTAVADADYLGLIPVERYAALYAARREVTATERLAARDAWLQFRAPDPRQIADAMPRLSALPRVQTAFARHLQQFPARRNGLSRTEQQALEILADGPARVSDVYTRSHHGREPAIFMGDAPFIAHIRGLAEHPHPLLRVSVRPIALALDDVIELTDDGRRVLDGADRVSLCGIERWLGGVHLEGRGPVWRWDGAREELRFC